MSIILPQTSGYIKYLENGGKNISFVIKGDDILDKHNKIWNDFNGVIKPNLLGEEIPKENVHYACIACITIDSVMRMEKENYPQIYLEQCKYKLKKLKMTKFRNTALESDSELELESDTKLESKLESKSDSDSEQLFSRQ